MKKHPGRNVRKLNDTTEYRVRRTTIRRTKRTDSIIRLRQNHDGDVDANPATYNRAFASVLRQMADAVEDVRNAWVDPEVIVWMHRSGEIVAEVTLSPGQ